MRRLRLPRDQRGVTLVELMVVVAVVGLLAAMFLTRYAEIRRDAADARAQDLLGQLRTAVIAYEARTGAFPSNMAWSSNQWDSWVSQVESVVADLRLPRQAVASTVVQDALFGAGSFSQPYGMGLVPRGGRGVWFLATSYVVYRCPSQGWNTTGCTVVQ